MPPATGHVLTDDETIAEALAEMSAGSVFVFNDRSEPLVVLNREAERGRTFARIRGRENATVHTLLWGDSYDRPRHKPHERQTNYVEELKVISYGSGARQASLG